jgi:hypothetical protein
MALHGRSDPKTVIATSDTSNHESGKSLVDALPLQGLRQE